MPVVETYRYQNEKSETIYEVDRIEEPGEKKTFRQYRIENGVREPGLAKDTPRLLYRLPQVLAAERVFVCEGEKDCHTLEKMGLVSTSPSGGAGAPWQDSWTEWLRGKSLVIVPDNDPPGQKRAAEIVQHLSGGAKSIAVLNVPRGKDVSDFLFKEGGTEEEFSELLAIALLPDHAPVKSLKKLIERRGEPTAIESEKLILGSILQGSTGLEEVACLVNSSDFSSDSNRRIFQTICELDSTGSATDIKAVIQALQSKDQIESVGGVSYLLDLTEDLPGVYNIDQHIELVLKKAQTRAFVAGVTKAAEGLVVGGDLEDARASVGRLIDSTASYGANDSLVSTVPEIIAKIGNLDKFFAERKPGIMCRPLKTLNDMTYGFRPGQLVMIGARPSVGKSSLSSLISAYSAIQGYRTDVISLEVSSEIALLKMICTISKVSYLDVQKGNLDAEQRVRMAKVAGELAGSPLRIDDSPSWNLLKIKNHCKKQHSMGDPVKVLVLDYLQLLQLPSRKDGRTDLALGEITRGLKLMAMEFGLVVILLSQLNRESERNNRKPQLSDFRESGASEQDSDICLLLWQKIEANDKLLDERDALIILAKQRDGPTAEIEVRFNKRFTYFYDPLSEVKMIS